MITYEPPYFWKNPKWYYHDPRYNRLRLTDEATPKAIQSYINHYAHYVFGIASLPNSVELASQYAKEDLEDYKNNKNRYTFKTDEDGNRCLIAIDGKSI